MLSNVKLFTGKSNVSIANSIADFLNIPVGNSEINHFADGEIEFLLKESVRNYDILLVQSTAANENNSVNDSLMELLIMIDTFKRSAAKSINVIIPYYGYARQDRKVGYNSSITAKLTANMIQNAGATSVLTLDLHSDQIQGFFDIPVDNLNASKYIADYILNKNLEDIIVVSPDMGGAKRAKKLSKYLDCNVAIINKNRPAPNVSEIMSFEGNVEGKNVIIVDDMIDTGGTVANSAKFLKEKGAKSVFICATHGLFSGNAVEKLNDNSIDEIIVCNTIQLPNNKKPDKLIEIDAGKFIGKAIKQIFKQEQLDEIFN